MERPSEPVPAVAHSVCREPVCTDETPDECPATVKLSSHDIDDMPCASTFCYGIDTTDNPEIGRLIIGTAAGCDTHVVAVTVDGEVVNHTQIGDFAHGCCEPLHGIQIDIGRRVQQNVQICVRYDRIYPLASTRLQLQAEFGCLTQGVDGPSCDDREVCDSYDNDCNGAADDGLDLTACCHPSTEICDGKDNDCDLEIDEGLLNACLQCGPTPVEVCDNLDNDCDSYVDEGLLNACHTCGPTPAEVCDGLDNDCDGFDDNGVKSTSTCSFGNCNGYGGTNLDTVAEAESCMQHNDRGCTYNELRLWCYRGVDSVAWDRAHRDWVDARCSGTVSRVGDTFSCYQASNCTTYECTTPLVLAFDPDQAVVYTPDDGVTAFNLAAAGKTPMVRTDWPTAATPWLVLDRDGDGVITSGEELFGSATPTAVGPAANGFAALAELDLDRDGRVDRRDPGFDRLLAWADLDGDRISTADELWPVSSLGIVGFEVAYEVEPRCDDRGNCALERGRFYWRDQAGTLRIGAVIDVHLAVRPPPFQAAAVARR
ncbi:MAG: hypothetical protein HY903_22770 [Deltaproteobacteria bacterium]|nr:hypothetical protein [Deltaproteobacteria bacterium]